MSPYRTPCCGYPTTGGRSDAPDRASVIKWNPYNEVVQCHNCGACYRMVATDQLVEGDEPFRLLALADELAALTEKLEAQFSTGAVVVYLQACLDALDAGEDTERNILRDAIDVLEDKWPHDTKVGRTATRPPPGEGDLP